MLVRERWAILKKECAQNQLRKINCHLCREKCTILNNNTFSSLSNPKSKWRCFSLWLAMPPPGPWAQRWGSFVATSEWSHRSSDTASCCRQALCSYSQSTLRPLGRQRWAIFCRGSARRKKYACSHAEDTFSAHFMAQLHLKKGQKQSPHWPHWLPTTFFILPNQKGNTHSLSNKYSYKCKTV